MKSLQVVGGAMTREVAALGDVLTVALGVLAMKAPTRIS
jgi:hypothetical protein